MIAVIGSGPAGVSCALYLKRANKDVIVFSNHKSSLLKAKLIENYYGSGSISGPKLYQEGLNELKNLNIPLKEEEIFNIRYEDELYIDTNKDSYNVDALILATGSSRSKTDIKNIKKYEGKGVSYCATCDGFFFKNKKVAVVGNTEYAVHELEYLSNITNDLYLLTNGTAYSNEKYKVITDKIMAVEGEDTIQRVLFDNESSLEIDGLFIANDTPDSNILAKKCGIITDNNEIVVNNALETNIPGIFACGDAIKGVKQISKAVYDGMNAATSVIKYISKK